MASHVSGTQKKRPVTEQHPPFRTTAFYTAVGRPIDARFIRRGTLVQGAIAQPANHGNELHSGWKSSRRRRQAAAQGKDGGSKCCGRALTM
jgi:hypothetical protein